MRIDKYLAYALNKTRSEVRKIIKSKHVRVNGQIIANNEYQVDEFSDIITFMNQRLEYQQYLYLMMNKPSGYLSATADNIHPLVTSLVEGYDNYNLFIAGRLDIDSEGFVLLTNDGDLAHKITSPKYNVLKKYFVEVEGEFLDTDIQEFAVGMMISDGKGNTFQTKPAKLDIIDTNKAYITISEGKFHQVKNMCFKLNKKVRYLKRIQIGEVTLDCTLKLGEYRHLTEQEIILLQKQLT